MIRIIYSRNKTQRTKIKRAEENKNLKEIEIKWSPAPSSFFLKKFVREGRSDVM